MSLVLNVEILGEYKKLTTATKGAQKQLSILNSTASRISASITRSLASIGVGFSLYTVINGAKGAVEAASDVEQQFGALDSIFKGNSDEMKVFAKNSNKLGLSTADSARNMALLGSLLKSSGMDMKDVSGNTKILTALAADLAATFGGDASTAVQALSSAFKGEFDPLEKYGVSIKKSDVNARMAAEGYSKAEIQTNKLGAAQTLMGLIMENTTDAQGQAGREADTYAGKMAYLKARFEDISAEIGIVLIPILMEFSDWLATPEGQKKLGEIIELVKEMVKWFGIAAKWVLDNKDWLVPMAVAIGTITTAWKVATAAVQTYQALAGLGAIVGGGAVAGGAIAGIGVGSAIGGFQQGQTLGQQSQIYGQGFKQLGSKTLGKNTVVQNITITGSQSAKQINNTLIKQATSSGSKLLLDPRNLG